RANPLRYEYLPTDKGQDFFGVLATINAWGDRRMTDDDGIPVAMHHTTCGHDTHTKVVCSSCDEPLHQQDVTVRTGPGAPRGAGSMR
ncbi:winged helix-turn-helix transcriptional regulator, partial [Streptomyces sp. NPDC001102]